MQQIEKQAEWKSLLFQKADINPWECIATSTLLLCSFPIEERLKTFFARFDQERKSESIHLFDCCFTDRF